MESLISDIKMKIAMYFKISIIQFLSIFLLKYILTNSKQQIDFILRPKDNEYDEKYV